MDSRRMCPNCRAFITTADRVCPYCDMPVVAKAVDRRNGGELLAGLIPSARLATSLLLLINFVLYAATVMFSSSSGRGSFMGLDTRTLLIFGAKRGYEILQGGEWWRLITAGFLHGGVLHILMNSSALYDLGAQVEEEYGTSRFLVIYFLATVCGFAASTWWRPMTPSVGASAGIFGLVGAMIALGYGRKSGSGAEMRKYYGRYAVYGLLLGILLPIPIDNAAHLGGLGGGFLGAAFLGTPLLVPNWRDRVAQICAAGCGLLTLVSFALMLRRLM